MIFDQIKLENNYNALSIKCFSCDQKGHLSSQCPLIHYVPNVDKIVKVHVYNPGQQSRVEILRNPAKSSHALSSKKEVNRAYNKFQKLLRQLYVMDNDSFIEDSENSEESQSEIKDISPIEFEKTSSNKDFNISMLKKSKSSRKISKLLKLQSLTGSEFREEEEENIEKTEENENLEENQISIERNENNKKNNEEQIKKNSEEELIIISENSSKEELNNNIQPKKFITKFISVTEESPTNKKFDLKINTDDSKSSCIKKNMKKKFNDLHLKEIPEITSVSNSSPEKNYSEINLVKKPSDYFEFISPEQENDDTSMNVELMDLDKNIYYDDKNRENEENVLFSNEKNQVHFNENNQNDNNSNMFTFDYFAERHQGEIKEERKRNLAITLENTLEPPPRKIHQIFTPPSIKNRRKSVFSVRRELKSSSMTPLLSPESKIMKKKKSVNENDFMNSPLLKLPIYNLEQNTTKNLGKERKKTNENENNNNNMVSSSNTNLKCEDDIIQNNDIFNSEDLEFDRVSNFKNYNPENNIKNIIKKMNKLKKKTSLEEYKAHQQRNRKRNMTKTFKVYFNSNANNIEEMKENRIKINQILPSNNNSPLSSAMKRQSEARFSQQKNSPEGSHKRPSSIFTSNLQNKNFFQHDANEITFYDVVYEVLTNKELRKKLLLEKMKSKRRKGLLKKNKLT